MKTAICAAAFALTLIGVSGAAATETSAATINIARIKSGLHLRADQQPYWPALETAVREVARSQGSHRTSGRSVAVVLDSGAVNRIASAARPLMATLDFGQLQAANGLASEMGLSAVVAALR